MAIQFNEGDIWWSNKVEIANHIGSVMTKSKGFDIRTVTENLKYRGLESSQEDFGELLCDIILGLSCDISENDLKKVCHVIEYIESYSWNMKWTSPEAYLEEMYPGGDWTEEEYDEVYRVYSEFYDIINPSIRKPHTELTSEDFADAPILIKRESDKGCIFLREGDLVVYLGYLPSYQPIG